MYVTKVQVQQCQVIFRSNIHFNKYNMPPLLHTQLSPDCRGHVFQFLSYCECLKYGELSRTSLDHVIRELEKRRAVQFMTRPCEELTTCMKTIFASSSSFAIQPQDLPPDSELVCADSGNGSDTNTSTSTSTSRNGNGNEGTSTSNGTTMTLNDDNESNNHAENQHRFLHHSSDSTGHETDNKRTRSSGVIDSNKPTRVFYALPSVLERIKELYQSIPKSHPSCNDLRDLISNLQNQKEIEVGNDDSRKRNIDDDDDDDDDDAKEKDKDKNNDHNNNLVQRLSSATYAHRLHAKLLSNCTVTLEPDPYYNSIHKTNSSGIAIDESFTVTLERYMGDVLAARCLIGHTYIGGNDSMKCGDSSFVADDNAALVGGSNIVDYDKCSKVLVEGGPSFDHWIDHLMSFQVTATANDGNNDRNSNSNHNNNNNDNNSKVSSAKAWYQYWVFFHSALLRVSPLSVLQAEELRVRPLSGILEPFDNDEDMLGNDNRNDTDNNDDDDNTSNDENDRQQDEGRLRMHRNIEPWFIPSRTFACYSCECRDVKVLSDRMNPLFRHNDQKIGILHLSINDFGPLGQFRGRDRVVTQTMLPHKLYVILLRNSLLSWTLNNNRLHHYIDRDHYREYVKDLRCWLNDCDKRGVMSWMKLLQAQSQKTAPMTVQPTLVSIRMTTLNDLQG